MISLNAFINKYRYKVVDVPWGYAGECVSLLQRYVNECFGLPLYHDGGGAYARGNGVDFGNTLIRDGDAINVPIEERRYGDIAIYDYVVEDVNYGHVDIVLSKTEVFDQTTGVRSKADIRNPLKQIKQVVRMMGSLTPDAPKPNNSDLSVGDSFTLKKGVVIYNDNPKPTKYTHQPTKDHPAVIVQESGEWYKIRVDVLDPTDVWVYKKDVAGKKEESKPKPKPASGKNAYGQSLKVGDPITFSRLYKTKDGEGGLNPDEMYYSKRNSKSELVGYGNIIAVLPNNHYTSYEVSSVKGGASIGFVRFDNIY